MESGRPAAYDRAPDDLGGLPSLVLSPTAETDGYPNAAAGAGSSAARSGLDGLPEE